MGRGAKIVMALVVGVPVVAIAVVALNAPREPAMDYYFPRVEIDATLEPDGDLALVERRTFDFTGPFSFAFFTIEPRHAPPSNIEDFTVSEDGAPVQVVSGVENGGFKATWYFDAQNERRTFTIAYTVRCAVDVYEDAAHLNWQFVGRGWSEPTDAVRVTVHLPDVATTVHNRDDVSCPLVHETSKRPKSRALVRGETRAWGHGAFNGTVRFLDPSTVRFEVVDLRPGMFVEGSVLLPPESVPFAFQYQTPMRTAILAEEQRLADAANALRRQRLLETVLTFVLYGLVPLVILGLVIVVRRRDRVADVPELLHEPPEDRHPAELAVLWSAYRTRLSPKNAYRAQLLHLARTGALELEPVGTASDPKDFVVRRRDGAETPGDRAFVRFLVEDDQGGPMPEARLRAVKPKGPRKERLQDWWKAIGSKTRKTVERMVLGRARAGSFAIAAIGWGAASYGWWRWTGFKGLDPYGLVGVPAAWLIPIGIGSWVIGRGLLPPRLSPELRERMQRWGAFRRFLRRFSSLPEAPTLAVTIWENYLVYAVALGVADRVARQVRAIIPADELEGPWPGAPAGDVGSHYYHRVSSGSAHSPSSAASTVGWSSGWGGGSGGGGGGGGFSGGGGGGGGGTGGGAG